MTPAPKDPERYELWIQRNSDAHSGSKHPNYGKHLSETTKRKISESETGKVVSEDTRIKISILQKGKPRTEETKQKIRDSLNGIPRPSDVVNKIKKSNTGLKRSEVAKDNIRKGMIGKPHPHKGHAVPKTTRQKLHDANSKQNHPQWKGGISFEPYCEKFDEPFKERVRAYWDYKCAECGEQSNYKLHVHHVNFDKQTCCNDSQPLFVPLCRSCHGKTNHDREYWESHFTTLIIEKHNGICYLPKECIA